MTRSNFRRIIDEGDHLTIVTEDKPGQERTLHLTAPGVQELVNTACERGFHPSLEVWATGWMHDYYENVADEDDDDAEKWVYMSPVQRREFIQEQAATLARNLSQMIEHHQYEPIPDLREE